MSRTLDALMAVMESAFDPYWREAWTRAQVADSLSHAHTHALLAAGDGTAWDGEGPAAGFVLARRAPGEEELLLIAVDPACRGRGVGRALLERFFASARAGGAERVFLEMRENNPAASLYAATGFAPIGRRRAYYRTAAGEALDAITLAKIL